MANTEEVKYSMSLSDMVTGKLEKADHAAKNLEGRMSGLQKGIHQFGERAVRVLETMGIAFATMKMEEFFHEGTEMAHQFDIAVGQLENTIHNVGERAGLSAQQMVQMATDAAKVMPFTKTQFVDMETALSRFGNMTPAVFQKVLALSADLSVALKRDGRETAYQLGRIFEAPAENARLLRRLGVTLDKQQQGLINRLEHTGHVAQAQTYLFQLLAQKGFAGAARAAADSDPLFRYNKIMERMKYSVGAVGITILETLAPALEKVAHVVETSIEWFQRHKQIAEFLAISIGALAAAYVTYIAVEKTLAIAEWATVTAKKALAFATGQEMAQSAAATIANEEEAASANMLASAYGRAAASKNFSIGGFMPGIGAAEGGAAAGVGAVEGVAEAGAVGASMLSGIGEIVAVVAGIGTLLYGISKMGGSDKEDSKTKEARQRQIEGFDSSTTSIDGLASSADGAGDAVQSFAAKTGDAIKTIDDQIRQAQAKLHHLDESNKPRETREDVAKRLLGALGKDLQQQKVQAKLDHEQWLRDMAFIEKHGWAAFEEQQKKGLEGQLTKLQKQRNKLAGALNPTNHASGEVSKVTGNHPIHIDIKIDSLIKGFTISTTNLSESTQRIKEEVTKVMLSAVNDAQVVAGI